MEYNQLALEDLEERLAAVRPGDAACLRHPVPTAKGTTKFEKCPNNSSLQGVDGSSVQVSSLIPSFHLTGGC